MTPNQNIMSVLEAGLCLGCGTCAGICPERALTMEYSSGNRTYAPLIDSGACTACGICRNVCPGLHVEPAGSGDDQLDKVGTYEKCFLAYANDEEIRYRSSSGGVATALSLHLLEQGPAVVVGTRMKGGQGSLFDTEPVVCASKDDLLSVMGSKYCPSAPNTAIRTLGESPAKSAAFIGLPCQVRGISRSLAFKPLKGMEQVLTIGLLCGGMRGQEATEWILKKYHVDKGMVQKIRSHRGWGWPGNMLIQLKSGEELMKIPYMDFHDEFFESWQPWRCSLCLDRTSKSADISLGDAWLPELKKDGSGTSLIIARTPKGLRLVEEAIEHGAVTAQEIDRETLMRTQTGLWEELDKNVRPMLSMALLLGRELPLSSFRNPGPGWKSLLRAAKRMARQAVLRKMTTSGPLYACITFVQNVKQKLLP